VLGRRMKDVSAVRPRAGLARVVWVVVSVGRLGAGGLQPPAAPSAPT
jgi:hypothetical protein